MITLALDTTTRAGSVAVRRGGALVSAAAGDPARPHGERLPGDVMDALAASGLTPADVDLWAVAAGPGSFTGLRIGIAAIQGFAFASGRPVAAVGALDALAHAVADAAARDGHRFVGAWMDAARHEVFGALFERRGEALELVRPPIAARPERVLDDWRSALAGHTTLLAGDGALAYADRVMRLAGSSVAVHPLAPPLAPAVAVLAEAMAARGAVGPPHAVRPIYVRRPDAETAREARRAAGTERP